MKGIFLLPFLAAALAPGFAGANPLSADATFPIPATDAIATVTIPYLWNPTSDSDGVQAASPRMPPMNLAVGQLEAIDAQAAIQQAILSFGLRGGQVEATSAKTTQTTINNLTAYNVSLNGTYKGMSGYFGLTLVATNAKGKFIVLSFWGDLGSQLDNANDMQSINNSVRATE
jgi:hypothetical protein